MSLLNFQKDLVGKTKDENVDDTFISIYLNENNAYLLNLENILKIGKIDFVSKIGICVDWFVGIINIQNNIFPLVDLTKLLKEQPENKTNSDFVLLKHGFALSCYKVDGVISKKDLIETSVNLTEKDKKLNFIENEYIHQNGTVYKEIDLNKMVTCFDFRNVFKGF